MTDKKKGSFFLRPDTHQCKDAGAALILIGLLTVYIGGYGKLVPILIVITLLLMIQPRLFKPWAALWFGLSTLLGAVMSRIILTILFVTIVTPIGLLRRISGADPLKLKQWKTGKGSVFRELDSTVVSHDIEQMF